MAAEQADALERLINLAIHLAGTRAPVTRADVRDHVAGYPPGQDDAAFARMFERDKEDLRAAGLVLEVVEDRGGGEAYVLDKEATFTSEVSLTPEEAAELAGVAGALARDPSFPYSADLALALAKITPHLGEAPRARTVVADEDPEAQGRRAAELTAAADARKAVAFRYTDSAGVSGDKDVEPFGLFLREGRWYLVGRDRALNEVRVYAVARMDGLAANRARPKTPDFDRPAGFDVRDHVRMPFQYGGQEREAVVRFAAEHAWRAPQVTGGRGRLDAQPDGAALWHVPASDMRRLARWVVEKGPGVELIEPAEAAAILSDGLAEAASRHG